MEIYSFQPFGYEGSLVSVEVDLRRGIPAVDIVGLADSQVKESRDRMIAAIKSSGFAFPMERVLMSLSPADLKKDSAVLDLPMALSVLHAQAEENSESGFIGDSVLVMGELYFSGNVRAVKGVHAACETAMSCGISLAIVPMANADEAREIAGMRVCGVENLMDAYEALKSLKCFFGGTTREKDSDGYLIPPESDYDGIAFPEITEDYEFGDLKDANLVRALQIAAAGGHSVIAIGAPGCGKTMAMMKFPALLPDLTRDEAQSATRIWSLAGLLKPNEALVKRPPFRKPHQSATLEGMMGGGVHCSPGEISLAHNGVLFLDEAAEFRTSVLQSLRIPVESGRITLSRAGRSTVYPASFQLLMAANPCPCGNYGSKTMLCLCSAYAVENYWKKFSSPLLDRIDIRVKVDGEPNGKPKTTEELRKDIARAVKIQRERQGKRNARLTPDEISEDWATDETWNTLDRLVMKYDLSARAKASCVKVARTIADMDGRELISDEDFEEAVSFRKTCDNLWNDM